MTIPDNQSWFCWLATRTDVEPQILHGFIQKDDKQRLVASRVLAADEMSLSINVLAAKYPPPVRVEQ